MKEQKFSIVKRFKSFVFAFNGLSILLREEHNARIHLLAALCAIVAGFVLHISTLEWVAVIFVIGFVISLELINSAIENISDFVCPERHDSIKKIKDLAAGGVLIAAITALAVGLIVFLPHIIDLF